MDPLVVALLAYAAGAIPFSNLVARSTRGVDLRDVGTGTVSGSGLYRVAGFTPMVVGGLLDVGKGALGPVLASGRPALAAVAGGLAVTAHNWSPLLRGAGGRGLSPAMGALAVVAWPGTAILLAGLALGRLARQTGLGSFLAQAALVPAMYALGWPGAGLTAVLVVLPMWVKRLLGNAPAPERRVRVLACRLLYDRDPGGDPVGRR